VPVSAFDDGFQSRRIKTSWSVDQPIQVSWTDHFPRCVDAHVVNPKTPLLPRAGRRNGPSMIKQRKGGEVRHEIATKVPLQNGVDDQRRVGDLNVLE
jgi:hypothetical protein